MEGLGLVDQSVGPTNRNAIQVSETFKQHEVVNHQRRSTSAICGSRVCTVNRRDDGYFEIFFVDFNMNITCEERGCVDPLIHFSPQTFCPNGEVHPLPWPNVKGMPFHSGLRAVATTDLENSWVIEALMDEERIVLSICKTVSI